MVDDEMLIEHANGIERRAQALAANARPPKTSPDRPRFALFLTIAELYEAALLLVRGRMASHAATHARSMTEALLAMSLLEKKENYVEQMKYEKLRGEKNSMRGY